MSVLVEAGRFRLGHFDAPLRIVNPLEARFPERRPWPRFLKRLRLKEWQHFGLINDEIFMTVALFDAKWMGLGQIVVHDRKTGRRIEHERTVPGGVEIPPTEWNSRLGLWRRGFSLSIADRLESGEYLIEFHAAAEASAPAVSGRFRVIEAMERHQPLVVCLPLPGGGALYTHKAIVPVEGRLETDRGTVDFDAGSSYGLIDIHKGFYPRVMTWNWATAAGRDRQGRRIGFNLTCNQVEDPWRYNENALWVDGALHRLPPVHFDFDRARPGAAPWRIADEAGRVAVTFTPEGLRSVDRHLGLFKSRYRGPFGFFTGILRSDDGVEASVDDSYGMCEDFYLKA